MSSNSKRSIIDGTHQIDLGAGPMRKHPLEGADLGIHSQ